MKHSTRYVFSVIIVFIIIVWTPLQRLWLHMDGAARVPTFLALFAVFINSKTISKYCFQKPLVFYFLLAVYMYINGLVFDSQQMYETRSLGYYIMLVNIFLGPLLMLIIISTCQEDFKGTLWVSTISLLTYSVMSMVSADSSQERLVTVVANANEVALMVVMTLPLVLIQYVRKQIPLAVFIPLVVLILFAVILTTSRMGFGMVAIIVVVSILLLRKRKSISSTFATLALLAASYLMVSYVVDNTVVGERLSGTTTQLEERNIRVTGTILDEFGDRGLQYYDSWPHFLSHPIFGIGFHQWGKYNPTGHACHSEYMVQYVECGMVGITLYLLFFVGLIFKLGKTAKFQNEIDERSKKVLFATLLSLVFGNAVLWNYNNLGVFIIYGLAYAIILRTTDRYYNTKKKIFRNIIKP